MNRETLLKAFLEVLTRMVAFDKMTEKAKKKAVLDAAVRYKGNEYQWYNDWFWSKYGEGGSYDGDVFALLCIGAGGDTEILILKYVLGICSDNIFLQDYLGDRVLRSKLRRLAVFYNNTNILNAFDSGVKQTLKVHKISDYGCPGNWAKLIVCFDEMGIYTAEQMLDLAYFTNYEQFLPIEG